MKTVGVLESVWRSPVKRMGGEQMAKAIMGFSGIYGDRCFAFRSSAAPKGTPYLSGSVQVGPERNRGPVSSAGALPPMPPTIPPDHTRRRSEEGRAYPPEATVSAHNRRRQ